MKQLTIFVIALLLFTVNAGALAGGKGHGAKHGNQHYQQKGHKYGHYNYRKHHYKYYGPYRGPRISRGYYGPYRGPRISRGYYRPNYYPSYLGAALIGSALSYSLYHTHNGAYCYDNHGNDNYQPSSGGRSYSEVVGCHRIEQLPDGSERRVELPMSQCN